jgi:hypothetical protein
MPSPPAPAKLADMKQSQPNETRLNRRQPLPPSRDSSRGPSGQAGRGPGRARAAGQPDEPGYRCKVKVGSADGILAVVPHLLGFHPAKSLVVLGIGGPHARIRLAFRYDLPDPADVSLSEDIAAHAVNVLGREHLTMAILVGYGTGPAVTPVIDVIGSALRDAQVAIQDALRVDEGRYWSYRCSDPACCSPDGVPYDSSAHPAAVALEAAGLSVHADRNELASTLARIPESAEPMTSAIERARARANHMIEQAMIVGPEGDLFQPVADAGRKSIRQVVTGYRRGDQLASYDEMAWLAFVLTDMRVRDDAWARMDPQYSEAHQLLWTTLLRVLPTEFVPAPAALLAFVSWQAGDGALATIAIERALDADPDYTMALLIADALHAGLPPSAARLSMTPKQVAASYAKHRRPPTRSNRRRD